MKEYLIPATGIVIVTVILIVLNELTESNFVQEYAYLLIIGGMLTGVVLAKWAGKKRAE
jgi:multisubunit Na+/H+ antiporter MnhF subunit